MLNERRKSGLAPNPKQRIAEIMIIPMILAFGVLLYLYVFGGCHIWLWPHEYFDEQEWRKAYDKAEAYVYVRDMIASERFIGVTNEQLTISLGPPDRRGADWVSYYVRGFSGRFLFDRCLFDFGANLVFHLGDTGRVEELTVFSH